MTASPLPPDMPLTPEHARQFEQLLATLTAAEARWISDYLAGLAGPVSRPAAVAAAAAGSPLVILYGSETGHAEGLARRAEQQAQAGGLAVRCVDLADFRVQDIRDLRQLLLITSTHGDGEPPIAAAEFCDFILSRKAPRLEDMKFAVLGLGDASYAQFCQTAKALDQRLAELGARRIQARIDCDVDYEAPAAAWIDAALALFAGEQQTEIGQVSPSTAAFHFVAPATPFDQKHPFAARLLDNLVLNGRGSAKETRHVELSLADSGLRWSAGDSLGVLPENAPALVAEIIARLGLEADQPLPDGTGDMPLAVALARHYEITTLTPAFIERYAEAADAQPLRALAKPGQEKKCRSYMDGRQIIDVLSEFPAIGLTARDFVALLRPQQPRLYSLASSPIAFADEVHLTVAVVRYASHGRQRLGVASGYLAERCDIDDTLPVYVSANKNFRLPPDPATPLIMIGPGTGVAPFRAFLQEREASGASGRNWLFFGDQHRRTDFLYQTEWLRLLKDGRLTRMDVAFSRDQDEKIYVQHRLLEHRREIHAWLEEGACIYVCGDASRMALDVHATLADIVASEGRLSRERAQAYLRQLQREKRYQRDVY